MSETTSKAVSEFPQAARLTTARLERIRDVLTDIRQDLANDARDFDGRPFNGRTVAEYFGKQGAQIDALAHVIQELINERLEAQL